MSKYVTFGNVVFKDQGCLVQALMDLGWTREEIVEGDKLPLYGYQGDRRTQTADIVIRRSSVNRLSGGSSNDLGFIKNQDGSYSPVVSDYDQSAIRPYVPGGDQKVRAAPGEFVQELERAYNIRLVPKIMRRLGLTPQPAKREGRTLRVVGVKG